MGTHQLLVEKVALFLLLSYLWTRSELRTQGFEIIYQRINENYDILQDVEPFSA